MGAMMPIGTQERGTGQAPTANLSAVPGAQAVDRALALLSLVGREAERGISLGEIVEASGLNKPTARRLLVALMRSRLVEQAEPSRRYFLSDEIYVLGLLAGRRHSLLDIAMESLRSLSAATGDTSFLSMRRDAYAVCLHREEGAYPVRTHALQTRDQHPLGVGAGSLAILAALLEPEAADILARNAAILTERYPAYAGETLPRAMADTRERGYALNPGLVVSSSWGVGLPVLFPDGRVAGALSVAAIDSRMHPERQVEIVGLMRGEARRIEAKLARLFSRDKGSKPVRKPLSKAVQKETHHV